MIADWMVEGQDDAHEGASSCPEIDLHRAAAEFPAFLAQLDMRSHIDPETSGNLLTIALFDFLHATTAGRLSHFGLARTKRTSDNEAYATLFIRPLEPRGAVPLTALGVPQNAPEDEAFKERVFPPSLDMEDHARMLRAHEDYPQARALVEQAVLRMLTPALSTSTPRMRL